MIKLTPTASLVGVQNYLHTVRTVQAIEKNITTNICDAGLYCDMPIPAFAYLSDSSDTRANDFRTFILRPPTGSTVTATIINLKTGTEYTASNTYGSLFPTGSLAPNIWAFKLDWYKVADVVGFGKYKVNISIENGSGDVLFDKDSPCFDLKPYSCSAAFGTVRIETKQTGYIESGFDYSSIPAGWSQQLRWYGKLKKTTPTTTADRIIDNNKNLLEVQTQVIDNYDLNLYFIHRDVSKDFLKDQLLSSPIKVQDYNEQKNNGSYRDVLLSYVDVPERTGNNVEFLTIKLVEYKQNTVKRYK